MAELREEQKQAFDETQVELKKFDYSKDVYSPTELNSVQIKPFANQSFIDDVGDEVMLTWIGQLLDEDQQSLGDYDNTFDRNFNPFMPENIEGYEEHADAFLEVRNQGHMDYIKSRIDINKVRYQRLESSPDRTFGPALVAGLFDPINYIPIPFVGGVTFAAKAVKGGLTAAAMVGATEPVRRAYNPMATNEETVAYVGTSFVLGGVLSGLLAPTLRRGVNPIDKRTAKKHITDKGGPEKLEQDYFNAHHITEGKDPSMFDGLVIRAQRFNKTMVLTEDINIKINVGRTGRYYDSKGNYTSRDRGVKPAHIFVKTKKGETTVTVDEVRLRREFENHKQDGTVLPDIPNNIAKRMKDHTDYINFKVKREIWKRNKYVEPRKKGETLDAFEARVTKAVVKDSTKQQTAGFETDVGNNFVFKTLLGWLDKYTDTGKVVSKFKNHPLIGSYIGRDIFEITGDFGAVTRGNKAGIRMNPSVHLTVQTTREADLQVVLRTLNEKYVEYKTGSKESAYMFGGNRTAASHKGADWLNETKHSWATNMAKMRNKLFNLKEELPDRPLNTWSEFQQEVAAAIMDTSVLNSKTLHPAVRESALETRKYLKALGKEANDLGLFANQKQFIIQLQNKRTILKQVESDLKKTNNPLKIKELNKLKKTMGDDLEALEAQQKQYKDLEVLPLRLDDEYFTRFWNREEILKHPDAFKNILRNHYKTHPKFITAKAEKIESAVDSVYESILDSSASLDPENILALGMIGKNQGKAGVKGLMGRKIDIENKTLLQKENLSPDGIPFMETNVSDVLKMYKNRMTTAIEITKRFGDRHMMNHTYKLQREIIMSTVEKQSDVTNMNEALNALQDAKDKLYGTFNTQDPASFNKQAAGFIRNIVSFASMGKVVFTAQADMGRPIMVHGFGRVMKTVFKPMQKNPDLYKKIAKDAEFINPLVELTQNMSAAERYYGANMGPQNATGGFFNKNFYQPAQKGQGIWYWMNGLTPWTIKMKQFTTMTSQHRFIEDAVKYSKGTLDKHGIERLSSYGIDDSAAKVLAGMPWEMVDGVYLPNARAWMSKRNGPKALSIMRSAVKADVERTIITPSPNDKLNMMYGVVRVNSDEAAALFDNEVGRFFGFTKTDRGGKFQNAFMALPFQFYSWMIAANRKLLMSGVAGRDMYLLQGGTAMVGFAIWGDFLKSPDFWYQKPFEEKILTGIEKSGVGAILSDLPHMLETVSGGEYGIRPMMGMEDPYGTPQDHDAFRPILGAAGSNILDIYKAFEDGGDKEQRDAIRRMLPLNNWLVWDRAFKKVYNNTYEAIAD